MKKNYFIYAASFFYSLGMTILGFSMVFRLTDQFLFTPGQIGVFAAMGMVSYVAGCNLYHRFGSIFEPIKVFPVSATVSFFASLPLSYSASRLIVSVSYCVLQMSAGSFWPPVQAWLITGLKDKELNREMGNYNRSWQAAVVVGPLIAGQLYNWNSVVNFIILNCSYLAALAMIFLLFSFSKKQGESLLKETFFNFAAVKTSPSAMTSNAPQKIIVSAANKKRPESKTMDRKLDIYRYKGWVNAFNASIFVTVVGTIIPIHIRDGLGFTERSAGLMLFSRSLFGLLGFVWLARFTSWHFNRRWFYLLQAGFMICCVLFMIAGSRMGFFYAIGGLVGFCNSGCYNNSMFYSTITGNNSKKNLAIHEISMSAGNAIGAAGCGFLYQAFKLPGTIAALVAVLLLGTLSQIYLDMQEKKNAVPLL